MFQIKDGHCRALFFCVMLQMKLEQTQGTYFGEEGGKKKRAESADKVHVHNIGFGKRAADSDGRELKGLKMQHLHKRISYFF